MGEEEQTESRKKTRRIPRVVPKPVGKENGTNTLQKAITEEIPDGR